MGVTAANMNAEGFCGPAECMSTSSAKGNNPRAELAQQIANFMMANMNEDIYRDDKGHHMNLAMKAGIDFSGAGFAFADVAKTGTQNVAAAEGFTKGGPRAV